MREGRKSCQAITRIVGAIVPSREQERVGDYSVRVGKWDSSIDVDVTDHYDVDYALALYCADVAAVCYVDPRVSDAD